MPKTPGLHVICYPYQMRGPAQLIGRAQKLLSTPSEVPRAIVFPETVFGWGYRRSKDPRPNEPKMSGMLNSGEFPKVVSSKRAESIAMKLNRLAREKNAMLVYSVFESNGHRDSRTLANKTYMVLPNEKPPYFLSYDKVSEWDKGQGEAVPSPETNAAISVIANGNNERAKALRDQYMRAARSNRGFPSWDFAGLKVSARNCSDITEGLKAEAGGALRPDVVLVPSHGLIITKGDAKDISQKLPKGVTAVVSDGWYGHEIARALTSEGEHFPEREEYLKVNDCKIGRLRHHVDVGDIRVTRVYDHDKY